MTEETYTNYLGTFKGPRPANGVSNEPLVLDTDMMEKREMALPQTMYNKKYGVKNSKKTKGITSVIKKTSVAKPIQGERVTFSDYIIEKTPSGGFLVLDKNNTQVKPTNKPLVEIFNKLDLAKESKKAPSELTTRQLGTKIFKRLQSL